VASTLGQFARPDAQQYRDKRKLFVVPVFLLPPDAPDEGRRILERYWSEVRDHVRRLERSLGSVARVYHEMVFLEGEEGLRLVEGMDAAGYSFVEALCRSTARLEAVEDRGLVEESADWQRCLAAGLVSRKVLETALEGYREATRGRYRHMARRIDETLGRGEVGLLLVREDHQIQFPDDVQVFYVAPPSLDALRRWLSDRLRGVPQEEGSARQSPEGTASGDEKEGSDDRDAPGEGTTSP